MVSAFVPPNPPTPTFRSPIQMSHLAGCSCCASPAEDEKNDVASASSSSCASVPLPAVATSTSADTSDDDDDDDAVPCPPKSNNNDASTLPNSSSRLVDVGLTEAEFAALWHDSSSSSSTTTPPIRKRQDYLSWDDYFLAVALLSARRSKDPTSPAGCCLVHPTRRRILGVGYQGFPTSHQQQQQEEDDVLPWHAPSDDNREWLWSHAPYAVHAAANAVLNASRRISQGALQGAHAYLTHWPCEDCTQILIQAGIQHIVYLHEPGTASPSSKTATRVLLHLAGVRLSRYQGSVHRDTITLTLQTEHTAGTEGPQDETLDETPESLQSRIRLAQERHRDLLVREAGYDPLVQSSGRRPRAEVLSWPDYFMALAVLTAQRSKDPSTQVGACLVDDRNRIVGLGYNGFPTDCSDDVLPWARSSTGDKDHYTTKYAYVVHAEVNALLNQCRGSDDGAATTLYVTLFPCHACARLVIQAGVHTIVYQSDKYHDTDSCRASRILLQIAGVRLIPYRPRTNQPVVLSLRNNHHNNNENHNPASKATTT